jgi:hypothetical protein
LLQNGFYQDALDYCNTALNKSPDTWFLQLNRGIGHYFLADKKASLKDLAKAIKGAPEQFHSRLKEIRVEIENGTYKLPQ